MDAPPAGWYADPGGKGQRYWDGSQWTQHFQPSPGGPVPTAGLTTDGFAIAALVFSIFGGIILSAIFAFVALRRIRQGRRKGRGLAIAALCITALWIAGIIVAIALDKSNSERFTGEKKRIARVVDRLETAFDNGDGRTACDELFTPRLKATLAASRNHTCEYYIAHANGGKAQATLTVDRLDVFQNRATARIDEGGSPEKWLFLRDNANAWRVDVIENLK